MSNYHDQRGTDRYAPPPRQRDTSSLSRPPPSGPSHQYSGPSVAPPPSIGPPRHPSSNYPSRPYDSVPRGPRLDSTPLHPRAYEPPPPRRTSLSLWSTQNPGGRDGYHHSGQPQGQARSYVQSAYRDYDRDPYDRDRDYRAPLRYRDAPVPRDSYPPLSGPRDVYRDQPRHISSSSYHPNYSTSPSPPTGPRHSYSSYQPMRSNQQERERVPTGPISRSSRPGPSEKRYFESPAPGRPRDHSPAPSASSRPRTPPPPARRDDSRRTSPYQRDTERRQSEDHKDIGSILRPSDSELVHTKHEEQDSQSQTSEKVDIVKPILAQPVMTTEEPNEGDLLTQEDVHSRIRAIDEEIEATQQRIAQIDEMKLEQQREIQLLNDRMQIPAPQVIETKSEVPDEEETEEDVEMVETPLEMEIETSRKAKFKIPSRKRPRPMSETEDEQENVRVRIWRMLKDKTIEDERENNFSIATAVATNDLRVIERVEDLSDFEESRILHKASRHAIFCTLLRRQRRQLQRQDKLRRKYRQKYIAWQAYMNKLDAQRQLEMERLGIQFKSESPLTPRIDRVPPETPGPDITVPDALTRGTRRAQQAAHAKDYVQSEAEFLELMQSLGTEEKDPTAEIPPMLLPDERDLIDFDDSGLIHNPVEFYTRALSSVEEGTRIHVSGWSEEEDKVFLRRLAIAGKQFGRFRRAPQLQHRSVQELVQHYYFLKGDGEGLDWRNVIAGKNRYGRGGGVGRANGLLSTGAPGGKSRGTGRGRGRGRATNSIPLLQPKPRDDDEDDTRSAAEDDADDSGSVTERVRSARGKRSKVIESTAAKQRPKRISAPGLLKERTLQAIAPNPVQAISEDGSSRERSILQSQADLAMSTDRDSSAAPSEGHKKRSKQQMTSSYWRINEMDMFPKHLHTFGKNWGRIAEEMGTKTAQQVKNYYSKNAEALGFSKIADEAENAVLRSTSVPIAPKTEPSPVVAETAPPVPQTLPDKTPQPEHPPLAFQQPSPMPPVSAPPKTLPTVASLLNSPGQEVSRPERVWSEPVAPSPLPLQSASLPLPMAVPDLEHEPRRMRSPSNASENSRSQSRGEYYGRIDMTRQPSIYSQPPISVRDEYRYPEDTRSQNRPPQTRYVPSPQSNLLPPPVRVHDTLEQRSSYYQPSPRYDSMPPPNISESPYVREPPYSRSPVQSRAHTVPSSLLPHSLPSHSIPVNDIRDPYYARDYDRRPEPVRDARYPPLRNEMYYGGDDPDRYRYEDEHVRYMRDRILQREMHIDNERIDRQRERDFGRDRGYPEYSRQYPARPRSPDRIMYNRDYGREEWERAERDRMERDQLERERWGGRRYGM